MKLTRIVSLSAALAILLSATAVSARHGGRRGGGDLRHRMHQMLVEKLGLTADQQTRAHQIRDTNRESMQALRQNIAAKRQALEDALMATTLDQSAIDARQRDLAEAQNAMLQQRVATRSQFLQILTPDQRDKLRGMISERRQHRAERRKARAARKGLGQPQAPTP